jgi:hypothetical protein
MEQKVSAWKVSLVGRLRTFDQWNLKETLLSAGTQKENREDKIFQMPLEAVVWFVMHGAEADALAHRMVTSKDKS